jgi:hypothetical protein
MFLFIIFFLVLFVSIFLYYKSYWYTQNYLNGIDIIYWINLDRAYERRKNMEDMFKDPVFNNIEKIRIKAIDGMNHDIITIINNSIYKTNDSSNKYEYACLLSHLNTINEFSKSNNNIALILEDDMTLEFKSKWKESIENIIINAPTDWEIIQLCYIIKNDIPTEIYTFNSINFHSTGAYIINKCGAKKFIEKIFINNKYNLDIGLSHNCDIYIFKILRTYTYKYPLFIYNDNNNSYIHEEHVENIHNRSKSSIIKYIYN